MAVTTASVLIAPLFVGVATPLEASANSAPTTPTLISPSSGATLSTDTPQLFVIEASDPDNDPYMGWVRIADADGPVTTFPTLPAPSGQESVGIPTPSLPPGDYTWTARAADLPQGSRSAEPLPQPFSVAGSSDAGGGPFTGRVEYSPALPPVGGVCAATDLSITATSAAAVVSLAPTVFTGFLNFQGSGSSACETATSGSGTLTLTADGLGAAGSSITCSDLAGQYLRVGAHLQGTVGGLCTINGATTDSVLFDIDAAVVTPPGAGVSSPISGADLDGAFVVSPAT